MSRRFKKRPFRKKVKQDSPLTQEEKLASFRWQVVHQVLCRYRKKNSLFFLIRYGLWQARHTQLDPTLAQLYLMLSGRPQKELKQLTALYQALARESNVLTALAATLEIARAVLAWEKRQNNF